MNEWNNKNQHTKVEHICGECKHFGYNVMGECICNLENGNKKASPYVGACEDNFTTKPEYKYD